MAFSDDKDGLALNLDTGMPELDAAIAASKFKCEKYMIDLITLFNNKYVAFENLDADIPFAANEAIARAEAFSQKLEDELQQLNESTSELKSSPQEMLAKVDSIITRLTLFKDLENLYIHFDADHLDDPLKLYDYYVQMSAIVQELEAEPLFANAQRAIVFNLNYRHQGIIIRLIEKYTEIFDFKTLLFDSTQFYFVVDFDKKVTLQPTLVAMERFGVLDIEVKKTAESIMNFFVKPLHQCPNPEEALKFERIETKVTNVYQIGLDRNIPQKNFIVNPLVFLDALELFFKRLAEALIGLVIEEKPIAAIFGLQITPLLFDFVVENILKPAIPYQPEDSVKFHELLTAAEKFHKTMVSLEFFDSNVSGFKNYAEEFDSIFVTRRCSKIIQTTRDLAQKIDLEMVIVGNDADYKVDILTFIKDFQQKVDLNSPGFATPVVNGNHLPKLLQFQRCKIPKNVFELAQLFTKTIDAAVETDNIESAGKLLVTAYNMMKIYDLISQRHNTSEINSVPLFGALFYNGCHYLNHVMMMKSMSLKQKNLVQRLQCDTNFFELIFEFRKRASQALENHLLQLRRQISSFIGSEDPFIALDNDKNRKHATRLVDGSMDVIERVAGVWRDVLTEAVHVRAIASLISHLFAILSNIILSKVDIHEVDAHEMVRLFEALIIRCEKLLSYGDQPNIQSLCEEPYYRFKEITLCLSQPLMNFADRWCDGIGPLANWLKIDQVKNLIRAIFSNSELRSQVLARIT